MLTVAVRELAALLAATVTVTDPLPDPLDGVAVTQAALAATDQAQPSAALTLTVALPPPASTETVVLDSV